jgi:N-acetylglucosaminyldiphosphoundecaprenol N-acetyl-beta-D-mannosaminyltransferase
MSLCEKRRTEKIIGTSVDITSHMLTCERVFSLVEQRQSAYICFTTAHMLVEASRQMEIRRAYESASIVNPDGTPIAWCLRIMGHRKACCVNGPTNTPFLLREAEQRGTKVGFYGGRSDTLEKMQRSLAINYPLLKVVYTYSPPFRKLTKEEQVNDLNEINGAGVQLLFVGLGSPKQELWMLVNYSSLNCVSVGVGAVFEFLSGEKILPPSWVQQLGLTWLVRLCQEPRRLAMRNLYSPLFVWMFLSQYGSNMFKQLIRGSQRKRPNAWRNIQ